jgi:Rha family phage regulatory protein
MAHITPMGLAPTLVAVDGQATTTSNDIAVHFNKRHADVIRAIENIESPKEFNERNFALVEFVDAKGEQRPAYRITRDGFTLLAMGFTGKRALAYIEAFNKMEAALRGDIRLKPMTPPKPVPPPTLADWQVSELTQLFKTQAHADRKFLLIFTRGYVAACDLRKPATEMAYLT